MDFGNYTRLASADYIGLDMSSVRSLKRAQDKAKVRTKDSSNSGSVSRDSASPEREARKRAGKKLDTAGHTIHQVEDILADTILGIRSNFSKGLPTIVNDKLLKSAEEMAEDIVGYARHDGELLFPISSGPIHAVTVRALGAYGAQSSSLKAGRGEVDLPQVRDVIEQTNEKLRGEEGVLPRISELAEKGTADELETVRDLSSIRKDARTTRREIEEIKSEFVDEKLDLDSKTDDPPSGNIDVAS